MKKHELPTDDDILRIFGNANFGEGSATPDARIRTVCEGLLKVASGYSCGATLRDILMDLKMVRYNVRIGSVLTAYGASCILAAHKRLLPAF